MLHIAAVFWLALWLNSAARVQAKPAQTGTLVVVQAASFQANVPLAPDSIAAAYGAGLATSTQAASTAVLPTTLAGTTVEVNGIAASLFFVSPSQINFLLPAALTAGQATVTVLVNNTVVARGLIIVQRVAPGIFTANANGRGVPAAQLFLPENVIEPVADCANSPCLPRRLNLCSGQAVLVLYLTGLRNTTAGAVRVVLGGTEYVPNFVGAVAGLAGLDQLNLPLPVALVNSGLTNLVVTVTGASSSNTVELNFAAQGGPRIERFDPLSVEVGKPLTLNGSGFSAIRERNIVRLLGAERQADAQVIDALPSQLTVLIPFGAQSGSLSITNLDGQCGAGFSLTPLTVRTSLSGFFKDTTGNKLRDLRVKVTDAQSKEKETRTNAEGAFVLADLAPGFAEIEVDGSTVQGSLPFPRYLFKTRVLPARDNQLEFPGSLQAVAGVSSNLTVNGYLPETASALQLAVPALAREAAPPITNGNVILEVPDNATIRLDGIPVPRITLSLVGNDVTRTRALTPVGLPPRQYSSTIVQIAPLGAIISPGAKLTFPNSDGFPANAVVRLFRLDQQRSSGKLGEFIDIGSARVSTDGQRIETATNAVTETSIYFVSTERPTVTVIGNVLEADRTPVRRALLGTRGRSVFTGNGDFIVADVPLNALPSQVADGAVITFDTPVWQTLMAADPISVEANYLRPTGKIVARKENNDVQPFGPVVSAGVLVLDAPPPDNPPVILADSSLRVTAGRTEEFRFLVTRGSGQSVEVNVTGADFLTKRVEATDIYVLSLSPGVADRGSYFLVITAINDLGRIATQRVTLMVQ